MADFKLKIHHPSNQHPQTKPLRVVNGRCIVHGEVKHLGKGDDEKDKKINTVKLKASHWVNNAWGKEFEPAQRFLHFRPAKKNDNEKRIRWAILVTDGFKITADTRVKVIASAYETGGTAVESKEVDLWVTPITETKAPTIEWPHDGYQLAGDYLNVFSPCGWSTLPVYELTFGGEHPTLLEWYGDPDFFWWAEYLDPKSGKPGTGPHDLKVKNADTDATIKVIVP